MKVEIPGMNRAKVAPSTMTVSHTNANQPPNPSFLWGATSTPTGCAAPEGSWYVAAIAAPPSIVT